MELEIDFQTDSAFSRQSDVSPMIWTALTSFFSTKGIDHHIELLFNGGPSLLCATVFEVYRSDVQERTSILRAGSTTGVIHTACSITLQRKCHHCRYFFLPDFHTVAAFLYICSSLH